MGGCFEIGESRGKIERSPVIAIFMPAVQHGSELFETIDKTRETRRFLNDCQQQAIRQNQAKIASLTVFISPISPWAVLSVLGSAHQRHFYYDPPQRQSQHLSMVGLETVVGCSAAGRSRFKQAQEFIHTWQTQFIYSELDAKVNAELNTGRMIASPVGHFFCSATFFDESAAKDSPGTAHFESAYVFVPQVLVTTGATASAVTFNRLITATTDLEQATEQIYQQLQKLTAAAFLGLAHSASNKVIIKDVASFEPAVTAALQQVKAGHLHKVVLADVMDVVTPQAVDVVRSLQTLRQNHPDCTIFSVGNGRGQSFIGASPERLLSITDGQLTTDALAGTTSRSQNSGLDRQLAQALMNSEKERYEHRVVVEFILAQLRSLNLNPHYAENPQLLQLLHVQHLHTSISATLHHQQSVQPLDILAKLHPTPAVAGVPRQAACKFIRQHETFERGLYAAPLGWIDTEGNSEFIVGIRSALIDGCKARLYAGAGIVAGSEPKKELAEIKLKLQTLLNALV